MCHLLLEMRIEFFSIEKGVEKCCHNIVSQQNSKMQYGCVKLLADVRCINARQICTFSVLTSADLATDGQISKIGCFWVENSLHFEMRKQSTFLLRENVRFMFGVISYA